MKTALQLFITLLVVLIGAYAGLQLWPEDAATGTAHSGDQQQESATGSHGGRLLESDNLQLEITVYERGIPPEFRIYAWHGGEPLAPTAVDLQIELARLGGDIDKFTFKPRSDHLASNETVTEPHSFDVKVSANHHGRDYTWGYVQHEGRVTIPVDVAAAAGLRTEAAGPAEIHETLKLQGQVNYDRNRVRHVRARYAGVVHMAAKTVGDRVLQGEVLARVESNDSLQTYDVKAPISGVIIEQQAGSGEAIDAQAIYTIANLDRVWVDLSVFPRDRDKIAVSQPVILMTLDGGLQAYSQIDYLPPVSDRHSQSSTARIYLDNDNGNWQPGMAVTAIVTLNKEQVPLAVSNSALQTFRDFDVVYARFGEDYEVRMLKLGRRDAEHSEVLNGLKPGTEYVTENSYLIKADIEKSGAAHGH